ncbi:MAG TPA: hypothetical protein VG757_08630 [Devosia sp.]|nr:hypothetical protein [Devosia sp.]
MLNAVLDRLATALSPPGTAGDRTGVPRLVAVAILAALSWALLAALVLTGLWLFRLVAGA